MPVETSAPPFANQQLPYAPKFTRPAVEDLGAGGSLAGSYMYCAPPSVAGSALIPGQARVIGSPHRAIPALSEAGYTPASLQVPSVAGSVMSNPYGVEGSYRPSARSPRPMAPSSILPNKASTMIQTGGWMPAASLPAPRRAPASVIPPRASPVAPSTIAPPSHRHLVPDDDASDAGYYSRRRAYSQSKTVHGSHKGSSVASSYSESSSGRDEGHQHRKEKGDHHRKHERHQSPSHHEGSVYSHSPVAPSPLAQASVPRRIPDSSLLSPHHRHKSTSLAPRSIAEVPHHSKGHDEHRHHRSHSHHPASSAIPPPLSSRAHSPRPPKPIVPSSVQIPNSPYRHVPIPPSVASSVVSERRRLVPGAAGFPASMYQAPSVVGRPEHVEVFDDGHSAAGSQLDFMDGAMRGKTSCYGLPKYPRDVKPDYRRFCVQRGNADVYLD